MPFPEIDPVAFSIGPLAIRWYALSYLVGIALGGAYGWTILSRRTLWAGNKPPFAPSDLWDFAFWAILGIVLGGRIGYVLFYNLPYFAANPLEAFALWDGGMSFHGGLIGVVLAMAFYTRSKEGNWLSGLDLLGAMAPIGLFLGRIANFINGELFGRTTEMPWGVVFPYGGDFPRHPSQLYEAGLEGILLFLVIRYATHVKMALRRPGLVAGIFGIGYALSRIAVEFFREPDIQLGFVFGNWLTMGMLLSLPVLACGILLVVISARQAPLVR